MVRLRHSPHYAAKSVSSYMAAVNEALAQLYLGEEGKKMINFLIDNEKNMEIGYGRINSEDEGEDEFGYGNSPVGWNPSLEGEAIPNEDGSVRRPAFIGLGHELAHKFNRWKGNLNHGIWISAKATGSTPIKYAEIFATHVENMLRSEHGVLLRSHYASNDWGETAKETRLIDTKNRTSIYVLSTGEINTEAGKDGKIRFVPLDKGQKGYKY